ncbi:lipoprotein-releasing ABC transporter ATP-binding protein LolD [Psychrobacter sanguinis]|jgi:lipoprotein-releasing system ATP-binding protein|uniref:lipoprotein-releasing ABC transporter ATP-binding protein LolD n=1 Tax=Psychrobacter sanguinis TaxID=861445 RepID=UPI00020C989A|nr:lipoprotein-releasing ABC transporter ATP-binding protein LolD [Psychrobacter sanguinis]EGK09985.1 lipoprotein ABC superfamily ATP binding cassette transporter, ABC protein [Psychrobacter sp. 1501(2011)]HBH33448.1 lipoprotein-releasing ABC transporter ATP-binding protein LolD [Psychrobacter sp.]MCC3307210.1 lipoprotein-releasing ABC transporter ATP-binding protein LolD [Psychrobacter sanguinis]MCC3345011.1 lipoprotein-releasing ABC transporter ATP-binding protein LolD [Psychrobacter sanguini
MSEILVAKNINKIYDEGNIRTQVLTGLNLTVNAGERIAIVGTSGSGKSTLLHLLGGLDVPTSGEVWLHGKCLNNMNETERGEMRNKHLGFIYQFHHLLPEFTAIENVAMPLLLRKEVPIKEARQQAVDLLERVGLGHRLEHRPGELSGGERQRVAIARALVTKPSLVLADEPTGNLDYDNAQSIFALLAELQDTMKTALLMVTHDRSLAAMADRQMLLKNGKWENFDH